MCEEWMKQSIVMMDELQVHENFMLEVGQGAQRAQHAVTKQSIVR